MRLRVSAVEEFRPKEQLNDLKPLLLLFRQKCGHAVNFVPIYPLILFSQLTPQQINGDSQQQKKQKKPTFSNGR